MDYTQFIKDNCYHKIFYGDKSEYFEEYCLTDWDEGIYIKEEQALLDYLESGVVTILEVPVPMPNPAYFYKFKWNLEKDKSVITFSQLYEKIKEGMPIELNGYWNDVEQIRKWVLKEMETIPERLKEKYKDENMFEGTNSEINIGIDRTITLFLPTSKSSSVGDKTCSLHFGQDINSVQIGNKPTNMYELYCQPNVATIEIKKSITFANFFLSAHEEELFNELNFEYGLGTFYGEQQLMTLFAEQNIAFGMGGNSSFHIWENKNEFVIASCGKDDIDEDNYKYHLEKDGPDHPATIECKKGYDWFQNLKATHKLLNKNSLSMSMWRWMAIETSKVTDEDRRRFDYDKHFNMFTVPFSGKLMIEDHYRKKTDQPDCVFAILKKL